LQTFAEVAENSHMMRSCLSDKECRKHINQLILVRTDDSWQKLEGLFIMRGKPVALVDVDISTRRLKQFLLML